MAKRLALLITLLCASCVSYVPQDFMSASATKSAAPRLGSMTPIQFAGDLSGDYSTQNVLKWRGKSLDAATMGAPTDAQIPIYVIGSSAWKSATLSGDATISNAGVVTVAAGIKGITQLTGEVAAGPGSGSQASVVTGPFSIASWVWNSTLSPSFSETTGGSTSTGHDWTISPQGGGATSGQPGNFVANVAAPNGGSAESAAQLKRAGSLLSQTGIAGPGIGFGETAFWLGPSGFVPSFNNQTLAVAGSYVTLNSPLAHALYFSTNNSAVFLYFPSAATSALFGDTGATAPVGIDWSAAAAPTLRSGTAATSFTAGTNKPSAALNLQAGDAQTFISATANGAGTAVITTSGSTAYTTRSITGNLTIDTTTKDKTVIVDTSSGVVSVTLPAPTNGREIELIDKKSTWGTNNLTLIRFGAEKIDNVAASRVFSTSGARCKVWSDGTDWYTGC